jgi:hypothetical protein
VWILWFKNRRADYFEFFKLVPEKIRLNRGKKSAHRYDADGYVCKSKRMVRYHVLLNNIYVVM